MPWNWIRSPKAEGCWHFGIGREEPPTTAYQTLCGRSVCDAVIRSSPGSPPKSRCPLCFVKWRAGVVN